MKIGFTGTQDGMTEIQKIDVRDMLLQISAEEPIESVHHGDCVGADEEFHEIADDLALWIVVHPPNIDINRAFCVGSEMRDEAAYLRRNRMIVEETQLLIAAPKGSRETRSGTWSTVRYARATGKRVEVIFP